MNSDFKEIMKMWAVRRRAILAEKGTAKDVAQKYGVKTSYIYNIRSKYGRK